MSAERLERNARAGRTGQARKHAKGPRREKEGFASGPKEGAGAPKASPRNDDAKGEGQSSQPQAEAGTRWPLAKKKRGGGCGARSFATEGKKKLGGARWRLAEEGGPRGRQGAAHGGQGRRDAARAADRRSARPRPLKRKENVRRPKREKSRKARLVQASKAGRWGRAERVGPAGDAGFGGLPHLQRPGQQRKGPANRRAEPGCSSRANCAYNAKRCQRFTGRAMLQDGDPPTTSSWRRGAIYFQSGQFRGARPPSRQPCSRTDAAASPIAESLKGGCRSAITLWPAASDELKPGAFPKRPRPRTCDSILKRDPASLLPDPGRLSPRGESESALSGRHRRAVIAAERKEKPGGSF